MSLILHILFASICLGGIAYEIYAIYFAQKSKHWSTITGTVLNAEVRTKTAYDEDYEVTHEPYVHYAYRVNGVLYESRRLFFGSQITSNYFEATDSLLGISKNKRVSVYYDPRKPNRSVLHPGAGEVQPLIILAYIGLYSSFLYFK